MHWTLVMMLALTISLASVSVMAWAMTGFVRLAPILLVGAWWIQQSWYWVTGDPLPLGLFVACDLIVFTSLAIAIWRGRVVDRLAMSNAMIMLMYPPMWIAYFSWTNKTLLWWALLCGTVIQMLLSAPWPAFAGNKTLEGRRVAYRSLLSFRRQSP